MSPFSSDEFVSRQVRVMQIIIMALAMGIVSFAVIVGVVFKPQPQNQPPMMAYIAVAFTMVVLGVRTVVPGIFAASQRKQLISENGNSGSRAHYGLPTNATDGDKLLFAFQTKTIIEGALLEGPAFFLLISYMTTGQWWVLGIVFALLAVMGLQFPTRDRAEEWVNRQLELLELERRP